MEARLLFYKKTDVRRIGVKRFEQSNEVLKSWIIIILKQCIKILEIVVSVLFLMKAINKKWRESLG